MNLTHRVREIGGSALDFLRRRRSAYRFAFTSPQGQQVLADLAKFCRADSTCFHADPRIHAALEGRREVWLRIQQHLQLSPEQLYVLFNGGTIDLTEEH